jgi:hypothetical protein
MYIAQITKKVQRITAVVTDARIRITRSNLNPESEA